MGQRLHGLEQVVLRLGLRRLSPALTLVVGGAGRPGEAVPAGLALIPLLRVQTKVARVEAQPHGGVGAPVVSPYLRTSSGRRPPAGPPRAPGGSEAQPHVGDVSRCPRHVRARGSGCRCASEPWLDGARPGGPPHAPEVRRHSRTPVTSADAPRHVGARGSGCRCASEPWPDGARPGGSPRAPGVRRRSRPPVTSADAPRHARARGPGCRCASEPWLDAARPAGSPRAPGVRRHSRPPMTSADAPRHARAKRPGDAVPPNPGRTSTHLGVHHVPRRFGGTAARR